MEQHIHSLAAFLFSSPVSLPGLKRTLQAVDQPVVLFRHQEAEADILAFQGLERGTVPDHQVFMDGRLKQVKGSKAVFQNPYQDEVGIGLIYL